MPTINPVGLELQGVLNFLAGTIGVGQDLAAGMAWGAINGHGAKAAAAPVPVHGLKGGTVLYGTVSMVGALNLKNGSTGLGLDLVCNQLAGTVGLEAQLALRIYAGLP